MNSPMSGGRKRSGWASFTAAIGVVAAIAGIISAVYTVLDHSGPAPEPQPGSHQTGGGIPVGPADPSGRPATDPAAFRGKWSGTITQFDTSSQYEVTIEITGGQPGSVVGTSVYPSLECRGQLRLVELDGPKLRLTEYIVEGGGVFVGCVTETPTVLTLTDDGRLLCQYHKGKGSFATEVIGEGVLRRA